VTQPPAVRAQSGIETSQATAALAAAELGQVKAALTTADINLQRAEVRSPVNGFVTNLRPASATTPPPARRCW
jgi:multidrug resistance efflux pump